MPGSKTLTAHIENLSHDGRGISQINGKTTFIRGALTDEEVTFHYLRKRSKFDEGLTVDVIKASSLRATPPCPHFGPHFDSCGGCSLQHMTHDMQIEMKQNTLLEQLTHFGDIKPLEFLAPITGPTTHYRRKARLGVKHVAKKEKVLVGFREVNGRYLADMDSCAVLHKPVSDLIPALQTLIAGLSVYNQIPQIEVACGDDEIALVFRHLNPLTDSDTQALIAFADQNNVRIYLQSKGLDTVALLHPKLDSELLSYTLPDHKAELLFHPMDFIQVNADLNQKLVNKALELLDLQAEDRVLDLFCGLGNFSIPMAKYCKEVIAVEGDARMVDRGTLNAKHNQQNNVSFHSCNLAEDFSGESWASQNFDKVLIDPPRTGAQEVIKHMMHVKPKRIVYVSCNPATLARDAGELVHQHGYQLRSAGILDMFPHTAHMESIALFEKD